MRSLITVIFLLCTAVMASAATGQRIGYTVNGSNYEGYIISPSPDAPLVLLVHDWDGLTDYEIRRAWVMPYLPSTFLVREFVPPPWRTERN